MILRPAIPAARMIPSSSSSTGSATGSAIVSYAHSLLEIHTYGAAQALSTELTALVLS